MNNVPHNGMHTIASIQLPVVILVAWLIVNQYPNAIEDGVSGKLGRPGRMVPLRMGSVAGRSMKKENKEQRNFNVN